LLARVRDTLLKAIGLDDEIDNDRKISAHIGKKVQQQNG
jgi:hypothetical protein